jgi:hypothetical protein
MEACILANFMQGYVLMIGFVCIIPQTLKTCILILNKKESRKQQDLYSDLLSKVIRNTEILKMRALYSHVK